MLSALGRMVLSACVHIATVCTTLAAAETPPAIVMLKSGETFAARLVGIRDGQLHLVGKDGVRLIPTEQLWNLQLSNRLNLPAIAEKQRPRRSELVQRIERDILTLLLKEPLSVQQKVMQIEQSYRSEVQAGQRSHPRVLGDIQGIRSPVMVPFVLRLLAEESPKDHHFETNLRKRLLFLTGYTRWEADVDQLAADWFSRQDGEFVTDFESMTTEARRGILQAIRDESARDSKLAVRRQTPGHRLRIFEMSTLFHRKSIGPGWARVDIHPAMLPDLVDVMSDADARWEALQPLQILCRNGDGKYLERLIKNPETDTNVRIVGAIGLWQGGYKPPANLLAHLIERTNDAELQAAALLALGHSPHPAAREVIESYRNAENDRIREAAELAASRLPDSLSPPHGP